MSAAPLPYFCPACQAIPQAGYCDLAACPTKQAAKPEASEEFLTDLISALRKRADWLRTEYINGGDREHLQAREVECRHLASRIEEGRLP
jgi:hypothetical protein